MSYDEPEMSGRHDSDPWRRPVDPSPTEVIRAVPTSPPSGAADIDPTERIARVDAPMREPDQPAQEQASTRRQAASRRSVGHGRRAAGQHERRPVSRRRRALRATAAMLAGLLVVLLVGGGIMYYSLNKNLGHISMPGSLGGSTGEVDPVTNLRPLNLLLMGSDSRAGADAKYGNEGSDYGGPRSDVAMLAHLSADRKSAIVVSIPRDLMVAGPSAHGKEGTCDVNLPVNQWTVNAFNEYFSWAGGKPDCTLLTLRQLTGVGIDGVAIVDFTGFKDMVNAIGTVPVCLVKPVKDPDSGANFPAGKQRLDGEQALSFVRVRHGLGDGGDLGRIRRQQDFLSSLIRTAMSAELLSNPVHTYQFLDAATKSLTSSMQISDMASIANSARNLKTSDITFISLPTLPYPKNDQKLLAAPDAKRVWDAMNSDTPWAKMPTAPTPTASASATAPVLTVAPTEVSIDVINASGKTGLGKQAAAALAAQGFVVQSTTGSQTPADGVVIHHSPADVDKAREVAAAFVAATLKPDGVARQALRVEVGRGASKVRLVANARVGATLPAQPIVAPPIPTAPVKIEAKTADEDICSGGED